MFSLRFKSLLIALAGMAVLSFLVVLVTAFAISNIQNQFRKDLEESALAQMSLLKKELLSEMGKGATDLESPEGRELFQERASRFIERDAAIQKIELHIPGDQDKWTSVVERSGNQIRVYDHRGGDLDEATRGLATDLVYEGVLQATLFVDVGNRRNLAQFGAAAQQVQRLMASLALLLFIALLGTFFVLWKTFKGHMQSEARSTKLRQMAYVGSLAGGLAHEIRNPLHAMGINLSVLEEEIRDPRPDSAEKSAKIVGRLSREVEELNASVTSFLEFARPEREKPEEIDLLQTLQEAADSVKLKLAEIDGEVTWRIDPDLVAKGDEAARILLEGRKGSLKQAFTNILQNAVQAMAENTQTDPNPNAEIIITLRKRDHFIVTGIRDHGPGIPVEDQQRIFDVFFSKKQGGSGFGLAIANRVIADHGGKIWVESSPGKGATFFVALPTENPGELY